ncbi:unnamed protein product [Thlaspi arvense]|uniref:Phytocyanin domain-containing protein n=1 Tax=Thlaspi arvense TaxID=13288 RepID=A0AAU9RV59_THLAR|nr:unnamed protein product [Thlaspi arvense]
MVHSRFLSLVLVLVTIASIFSTFAEANRGFDWGWGGGSNYSSGSGSSPSSGWGWGGGSGQSSGSGSSPGSGWSWGSSHNGSGWGWGWGWGWSPNNTPKPGFGGSSSGWDPKNINNTGPGGLGSGRGWGGHSKGYNATYNAPRKIIVGGDKEWTYGVNYSDWASKTAPFFLNDVLVFKYNPPAPFTHSVYLFSDPWSYEKCDVKKARMIASPKQGAGNGFEFVLNKMTPYYISCGEHDGAHCSNGTMKFTAMPILPRWSIRFVLSVLWASVTQILNQNTYERRSKTMALSGSQKKLLLLVLAFACLSSSGAEAWSWSWSNGSGWGWGSDGSSSSSSGPGSDSDGSSWRWGPWGSSPGWGWSWGSDGSDNSGSGSGSGSNSDGSGWGWGWGWGSDGSSSSSSGSGTNPDGSSWDWKWNPRSGWSWSWGSNHNDSSSSDSSSGSVSDSEAPRKIVVGGSEGWRKGLDYKEWASKNAPFYIDDVLVFKYDKHAKRRNNVYLFQDPWSYVNCDIKNGKKIGLTNKGTEESFNITLKKIQPYFFASGEHDGDYCSNHNMKFTVFPVPHRSD